jgi:phosphinothricin acetyltransferase
MTIRPVELADATQLVDIYNHYVSETAVTFEETPVSIVQMKERIQAVLASSFPWVVLVDDGEVKGYAYARPWSPRSAYRYTAESTIYLARETAGNGYGRKLYQELLTRLDKQGIKNVIGVIALPNVPSTALHESMGFRKVGEFCDIGFKFNRQISVGYWQLALQLNKGS